MAPPNSTLPPGSFLTCSSDDTIRIWTLDKVNENSSKGMYKTNIYSNVSKMFNRLTRIPKIILENIIVAGITESCICR